MNGAQWYRWDDADLVVQIKVIPKASSDAFVGVQNDHMRVRITAPPVDGKANAHLIAWLAKLFGVAKSAVAIEAGELGRSKRLRIRTPQRLPDDIAPRAGR